MRFKTLTPNPPTFICWNFSEDSSNLLKVGNVNTGMNPKNIYLNEEDSATFGMAYFYRDIVPDTETFVIHSSAILRETTQNKEVVKALEADPRELLLKRMTNQPGWWKITN